ncbi:MAG: hypothetical protein ACP5IJ_02980, partial [Candidatus Nanoarchaeia archaeon]
ATGWKHVLGGTLTLYRNGTVVNQTTTQDSISEIIQLAAGTYNYTLTLDHQNYTANPITRILTINKGDSQLTLTASPSWNVIEGTSVTISCSAVSPLVVTLKKDNVVVSNPYQATLPFGVYQFCCEINDQQNYTPTKVCNFLTVSTTGFGCSKSDIYAFSKIIETTTFPINLNFTNLVNKKYVKKDLSDVWVNTTILSANKNTTNGYYLVVSNTTPITQFEVKFGNYLSNLSYSNGSLASTTINVENYTESQYYYVFYLLNEKTGNELLPPSANTSLLLACPSGITRFDVKDTKILVPSIEKLDKIRAIVSYSPSEVYYRDYFIRSNVEYKYVYLVDANQDQVLQMIFKIQDLTGNFKQGIFKVKRYLGGMLRDISETQLDIEDKAIVYLINGFTYQIYINKNNQERNLGEVYPDPSNLEKTIVITDLVFTNHTEFKANYSLTFDNETGTITFSYSDPTGNTLGIEFFVYNYSSEELLYYANSTEKTVSFTYIVPDKNQQYLTRVVIHNRLLGENTVAITSVFGYVAPTVIFLPFYLTQLLGGTSAWFLLLFVFPIALLFGERSAGIALFVLVGLLAFFVAIKSLSLPNAAVLLGLVLLLAIITEINARRREQL